MSAANDAEMVHTFVPLDRPRRLLRRLHGRLRRPELAPNPQRSAGGDGRRRPAKPPPNSAHR